MRYSRQLHSARSRFRFYLVAVVTVASCNMIVPSYALFTTTACLVALAACFTLLGIARGFVPINCFAVMSASLSIAYGIGTVTALVASPQLFVMQAQVAQYSYALFACALVSFASANLAFAFPSLAPQLRPQPRQSLEQAILAIVGLAFVLMAYALGAIDIGGAAALDHRVSALGSLTSAYVVVLPVFLYDRCFRLGARRERQSPLLYVSFCVSVMAVLPLGRRAVLVACLLLAIYACSGRLRAARFAILASGLLVPVLIVSSIFTVAVRVASYELAPDAPLLDRIDYARNYVSAAGLGGVVEYMDTQNRDRGFVLRFLSDLLNASREHPVMGGTEIYESVKQVVPRNFGVDKYPGDIENISQNWYGLTVVDEANSLLTTGAADFGFIGAILLPLAMAFLYQGILQWATSLSIVPPACRTLVTLLCLSRFLSAEASFAEYFVVIRESIVIVALASAVLWLTSMFLARRSGPLATRYGNA